MKFFNAINAASTTTSHGTGKCKAARLARQARKHQRGAALLADLVAGRCTRRNTDGKVVSQKKLNPGRTVQTVFMLLGIVGRDEIEKDVPDLAKRFDGWDGCSEAIMHAAAEKEVDVDAVAHLFGLVAAEDKVVAAEEPVKKTPRKRSVKKAA